MGVSRRIWSDPLMEPKRQFRFLFSFGNAEKRLPSYICQSVGKPSFKVESKAVSFINHEFKFPSRVKWEDITVKIVDPLDVDAADALEDVLINMGYVYPDQMTANLSPPQLQTISKARSASGGAGGGVKGALGQCFIDQIDSLGTIRERWTLHNAWIASVKFGDLSYESDDLVMIDLSISYDWATQESFDDDGQSTGNTATEGRNLFDDSGV